MKRILTVLAVAAALAMVAPAAYAGPPAHINGGGTGTFGADLDGDGDIDGSHFGLGVTLAGGTVHGHFLCLMAGNADFLGLPLMAVEGKVTGGSSNAAAGIATITGSATVNLGHGQLFRDVPFEVTLVAGGPGAGSLQLTVIGAFDGVPGDTILGNGNYDLPIETVATGHIKVR